MVSALFMNNHSLNHLFAELSTPLIADACLRLKLPYRVAPPGIHSLTGNSHLAGHVLPVRHYGSVDIFLEVITTAQQGDMLVIDNSGRLDEACIGDLTVLEAQDGGLAAIIVWGVHRDTAELLRIGFPVFSYGAYPVGPERLDPRDPDALTTARFGAFTVISDDIVFADEDGVVFISSQHLDQVLAAAQKISVTERRQAQSIRDGHNLRQQLNFADYLSRRATDPSYTFRAYLRTIGGAIEE